MGVTHTVIVDRGGLRLVGQAIARSAQDLTVLSVEPVAGLRAGVHMPCLAMQQGGFSRAGELTEQGWQTARRLVAGIDRDWTTLQGLLPALTRVRAAGRAWAREESARRGLRPGRALWAERCVLRRQLLHEGLDPGVFQRRLGGLRREREAREAVERAGERWVQEWLFERGIQPVLDMETFWSRLARFGCP